MAHLVVDRLQGSPKDFQTARIGDIVRAMNMRVSLENSYPGNQADVTDITDYLAGLNAQQLDALETAENLNPEIVELIEQAKRNLGTKAALGQPNSKEHDEPDGTPEFEKVLQ